MNIGDIFDIEGKISLTPEQALKYFGFKMQKGARGIIFYKSGGKRRMRSWWWHTHQPNTESQLQVRKVFKTLSQLGSEHLEDIIRPLWEPQAQKMGDKYNSGYSMFMSLNLKRVAKTLNWQRLLISVGELELPVVRKKKLEVVNGKRMLKLWLRQKVAPEIGIGILDTQSFRFVHLPPRKYKNALRVTLPHGMDNPIIYLYFKTENRYSNSVAAAIK